MSSFILSVILKKLGLAFNRALRPFFSAIIARFVNVTFIPATLRCVSVVNMIFIIKVFALSVYKSLSGFESV
ncbi:MAG: hypothetical protein ACJAXH_002119 [Colwellia sp.]|jgi:hypothetical protein